jgi:mannosyltransferase OCH1-like enzyme
MGVMTDHEILATGKGAHAFRFNPPGATESRLDIPRQLHMVWIGSRIPDRYLANVLAFAEHNPTWTVNLWADIVVGVPGLPGGVYLRDALQMFGHMRNRDLFVQERNIAAKVDLLRYEIIYFEGGVYLDADTESLGPGSLALMGKAFLAVSGDPWFNTGNAQFGFAQGSEFLDYVIDCARDSRVRHLYGDGNIPGRTGPTFLTTCALSFDDWRIIHPSGRELLALVHHRGDKNW